MADTSTRVLVLGSGYAGLAFIQALRRKGISRLDLTLVDRNPYHTLLTETHAVAAGTLEPDKVAIPLSVLGSGLRRVQAEVYSVDADARAVATSAGTLRYDYLVFGLGGRDHDFGIPGVREHTLSLRGVADAERIHCRLQKPAQNVIIVGGGLTGVELAAVIALRRGDRRLTLVEAGAEVLPGLPPDLQRRARRRLGWLGVNVAAGVPVIAVTPGAVHLRDGSLLKADLVVWAAGVQGHPLLHDLGIALDHNGRAEVDLSLRSSRPEIYVLGDSAVVRERPDAPALPPSGQLAEQMGFAAAADLASRLSGGPGHRFRPRLAGVLIDLGGLNASGLVYRWRLDGLAGAAAKRAAVLGHLWRTTGFRGLVLYLRERLRHWLVPKES